VSVRRRRTRKVSGDSLWQLLKLVGDVLQAVRNLTKSGLHRVDVGLHGTAETSKLLFGLLFGVVHAGLAGDEMVEGLVGGSGACAAGTWVDPRLSVTRSYV